MLLLYVAIRNTILVLHFIAMNDETDFLLLSDY